ncbi:MAG TPA: VOC family protein [Candidatus Binatus sp.]|uniref:VOC family protein n=1 Tax=Candidatus Binatus sp. TaxID=2811406 RepID=UPI002B4947BE|nr:VOC family protein [Candidatus Binatus sp.]HKN14720.1 VOC family protein [Candidatus Binatus sp.]
MIKARGLKHINLNVRDIARSLKFYQEAFGLEVKFWEGKKMVFLHSPGVNDTITLCQAKADDPVAGGGVSHFGFSIGKNNLDEMVRQVEQAGGKLKSRGEHEPGHPYAYLADPDGYVIELGNS